MTDEQTTTPAPEETTAPEMPTEAPAEPTAPVAPAQDQPQQ
jgi:hypothetical protein